MGILMSGPLVERRGLRRHKDCYAGRVPANAVVPERRLRDHVEAPASAYVEVLRLLNRDGLPPGASRRSRMHASRVPRLIAVATLVVVAGIAVGAASRPHSVEFSLAAPQLGEVATLVVLVLAGATGLVVGSNRSPIWVLDPNRATSAKDKGARMPWGVRAVLTLLPSWYWCSWSPRREPSPAVAVSLSTSRPPDRSQSPTRPPGPGEMPALSWLALSWPLPAASSPRCCSAGKGPRQ